MDSPKPHPARTFAEAAARFDALRMRDGAGLTAQAASRLWSHGRRTPLAIVLLHGFTNCPEQWSLFAAGLHRAGHTVVVPRLPGHGYAARLASVLANVPTGAFLATVSEAVDIASGAGERVSVAGLSSGGALAAWVGQHRADVARVACISSLFGILQLPPAANGFVAAALATAPDATLPWDPYGDQSQIPPHGYPGFSTRALGRLLGVGTAVAAAAKKTALAAASAVVITNDTDPAVSSPASDAVAEAWNARRPGSAIRFRFSGLPVNHDIVDPSNPLARLEVVYPALRAFIEGT